MTLEELRTLNGVVARHSRLQGQLRKLQASGLGWSQDALAMREAAKQLSETSRAVFGLPLDNVQIAPVEVTR